jgi:hypothetical protein
LAPIYRLCSLYKTYFHRKEIGKLLHCSKERIRNTHLRVQISILKYCFIVELFEKWHSALPPPPIARLIQASHLGVFATQFGVSPRVKVPNPGATRGQGGGLAWVALWLAFPQTQGISFLSRSP